MFFSAKNPFYNKDTREVFRGLFGQPNDKLAYIKVSMAALVHEYG